MKTAASLSLAVAIAAPGLAQAQAALDCVGLEKVAIPASAIGLPTTGGAVTAAKLVRASGAVPEHCLVSGEIRPVDPTAPNIRFEVALPTKWNSKAVMLGGGGFNGVIPAVTGNFQNASGAMPTPLARGYAVFGSDSGHQARPVPPPPAIDQQMGEFFGTDETYRNYISDAVKKTRDAASLVIKAAYGRVPSKAYFLGGSKGGGEALLAVGRWGGDWDGAVSWYPARNYTVTMLGGLMVTRALAAPGAYVNVAKRGVLHRAVTAACDGLDGVKDGIISNVQRCNATFDPVTARLDGAPIRCPGGAEAGDACLSDRQIAALKKANGTTAFNFPLVNGQKTFPGYNIFLSGLGASTASPLEPMIAASTIGTTPATYPASPGNSYAAMVFDNFVRFAVAKDPTFNQLTLDPSNPGPLAARLSELSALDGGDADLSAFAAHGGKLLIMHGTEDMLPSVRGTEAYYHGLKAKMGARQVDGFLRYYEIPGFGHGGSTIFHVTWDQLTALEGWAERGTDPAANQIVTDMIGVPGRTRPACLYPTWPKYKGAGDVNVAASFTCAAK